MYSPEYVVGYIFNYLFLYNLNMICLINLLLSFTGYIQFVNNFIFLNYSNFFRQCSIILIFSFSGIPPFIFFFYKLDILYFLMNIDFKVLLFIYILLFVGLLFYLQLIRYLMWLNNLKLKIYPLALLYLNYGNSVGLIIIMFINSFGFFFLDDLTIISFFFIFE